MAQKSHKNNKHIAELIESATVTALQLLAQVDKFAMLGGIDASLPDDQARAALRAGSIVLAGPVSNPPVQDAQGRRDWPRGVGCLAEKRWIETLQGAKTPSPRVRHQMR